MVRKKPKQTARDSNRAPFAGLHRQPGRGLQPPQAREWRGWTQDEAAAALEPYLGVRWSKATFSQAERSVAGRFIRNFTADEIVAFARGFELPVTWFFMPPPPWAAPGMPTRLAVPDEPQFGEPVATLVDLVFGDDYQQALVDRAPRQLLGRAGPNSGSPPPRAVSPRWWPTGSRHWCATPSGT